MFRVIVVVVAFVALLLPLSNGSPLTSRRPFPPFARRDRSHRTRDTPVPPTTYATYTQVIDHFNPESDAGTFSQRILYSTTSWGASTSNSSCPGPIFFYTGNESPVTDYWSNSGFMFELAASHGALVVFAEHRYFGESMPFGNDSFSNGHVGYLSPDQALADYATFLTDMKGEIVVVWLERT
jgi:hypothetical protein